MCASNAAFVDIRRNIMFRKNIQGIVPRIRTECQKARDFFRAIRYPFAIRLWEARNLT